jgi:hypothetical protein
MVKAAAPLVRRECAHGLGSLSVGGIRATFEGRVRLVRRTSTAAHKALGMFTA